MLSKEFVFTHSLSMIKLEYVLLMGCYNYGHADGVEWVFVIKDSCENRQNC